jgi:hypothetical protein
MDALEGLLNLIAGLAQLLVGLGDATTLWRATGRRGVIDNIPALPIPPVRR